MTFTDGNGHTATWKIIGIVNDNLNQIPTHGVILSSADNLERFLERPADSVGMIYIQAHDYSPAALQQLTNQVDQAMQTAGNAAPPLTKQDEIYETERTALLRHWPLSDQLHEQAVPASQKFCGMSRDQRWLQ